jgi:hypothetical protein
MATTESARHQLYQRLNEIIGPNEADTLMELLPPVGWAEVATKADLVHHADQRDAKFNTVDMRFEQVDARFEQVDARFGQIDTRFDRVEDEMTRRFDLAPRPADLGSLLLEIAQAGHEQQGAE